MKNPESIEEAQKMIQTWIESLDPEELIRPVEVDVEELGNLLELLTEVRKTMTQTALKLRAVNYLIAGDNAKEDEGLPLLARDLERLAEEDSRW